MTSVSHEEKWLEKTLKAFWDHLHSVLGGDICTLGLSVYVRLRMCKYKLYELTIPTANDVFCYSGALQQV